MKRMLGLLKKKQAIQVLVVFSVSLLIWVAGPLISFADKTPLLPELNRVVAILLLVIGLLVYSLYTIIRSQIKDQSLIAKISDPGSDPDQATVEASKAEELAILRNKFEKALHLLKKSQAKKKWNKRYLYELPWYLIIGAPGSGKTTLLMNSGLEFPLSDTLGNRPVEGVGGTRNCDWLFTNDAIFLDTAGRYATQDSHETVDKAAWHGFLDLLKTHRPLRPVNGLLVTVSIPDLIGQHQEERVRQAASIRQRILELYTVLKVRIPVYLLVTKCDLVAGFNEFFSDMGQEERAQVWGETFQSDAPDSTAAHIEQLDSHFHLLLKRLGQRTIRRMREEVDVERRGRILDFPQEMELLKPVLMAFLKEAFSISRFETPVYLRGVYFTSGTQEGTPIDRLMGLLADAYGLNRQKAPLFSGRGRSFFITRLLKDVLFSESELVGMDSKREAARNRLYWTACGAMILLFLGITAMWAISYALNRSAAGQTEAIIAQYGTEEKAPLSTDEDFIRLLLARMAFLKRVEETYDHHAGWAGGGLYQGDKIRSGVQFSYRKSLQDLLLPWIQSCLEYRIIRNLVGLQGDDKESLSNLIRVYWMLANPESVDPELMERVLWHEWQRVLPREPGLQAEMASFSRAAFDMPHPAVVLNPDLLHLAHEKLNSMPMAYQVYNDLKNMAVSELEDFVLGKALGRYGDLVFTTNQGQSLAMVRIPGLFTYQGYHDFFRKRGLSDLKVVHERTLILEGDRPTDRTRDWSLLFDDVQKLYFKEYEDHWRNAVEGIRIRKAKDLNQSIEMLGYLSGPESPVQALLEVVSKNTMLADETTADPLGLIVHLERRFREIHRLLEKTDGRPGPLEKAMEQMAAVRDYMMQMASAARTQDQALEMMKNRIREPGSSDPIKTAEAELDQLPRPVKDMLLSMVSFDWKQTVQAAKSGLAAAWKREVQSYYALGLNNRYPLFKGSQYDATMDDFCRFFAADGLMEQFFQKHLKPFVDTSGERWKFYKGGGDSLGLSEAALRQFQYAEIIRDGFFPKGASRPFVRFQLKPLYLDERIATFRLSLMGHTVEYRHGPALPETFEWPGPRQNEGAEVTFRTLDGREIGHKQEGPWALFRLLDMSYMEKTTSAERLIVSFLFDGYQARFELRASSVYHPFSLEVLQRFRCPEAL